MEERILRWESNRRYYAARLRRDLLGDWILECAWGGRFNNLGHCETIALPDCNAGHAAIAALNARRLARHYRLVQDKLVGTGKRIARRR